MRILPVILVLLGVAPALAQSDDAALKERQATEASLEELNRDMEAVEKRETTLAQEIDALKRDRASLNKRLIDTAARIKATETAIVHAEERIKSLTARESALRSSFRERRGVLAELLAALQRVGRRPPPAVLVSPDDALKTIRTAMLLGAVLPSLKQETEALAADLKELVDLRKDIAAERTRLVARNQMLGKEEVRLEKLVEVRQATLAENEGELGTVRQRAQELAKKATGLQELIASLDREIAVAEREAAFRKMEESRGPLTPQQKLAALHDPARLKPAIPFAEARGLLPIPASGAVIRKFGAPDDFGGHTDGVSVATRNRAQVTAPNDGWVVYSGPFRSYGQLLILNAGDGYHVLLAGMERIAVEVGQFVLAGEPVGRMGGLVSAKAEDISVGRTQPILYIEFRKDGRSIDPAPWWAQTRVEVSG